MGSSGRNSPRNLLIRRVLRADVLRAAWSVCTGGVSTHPLQNRYGPKGRPLVTNDTLSLSLSTSRFSSRSLSSRGASPIRFCPSTRRSSTSLATPKCIVHFFLAERFFPPASKRHLFDPESGEGTPVPAILVLSSADTETPATTR